MQAVTDEQLECVREAANVPAVDVFTEIQKCTCAVFSNSNTRCKEFCPKLFNNPEYIALQETGIKQTCFGESVTLADATGTDANTNRKNAEANPKSIFDAAGGDAASSSSSGIRIVASVVLGAVAIFF